MADEQPAPEPQASETPAVRRRPRAGAKKKRKRRGGILAFLIASAVPLAGIGWFALQPEEKREALLAKFPTGAGGRAIQAGIAFGLLILLARVALPAFHGASASLGGLIGRIDGARMGWRIVLFPVRALLWLLWFLMQLLFAVDAFLILVTGVVGLLLTVRIVYPDFLPGFLETLPSVGGETTP